MARRRRIHTSEFKAKIALELLFSGKTIVEIAKEHELHPSQVTTWKNDLLEKAPLAFESKLNSAKLTEQEVEKLHAKIGELTIKIDDLTLENTRLANLLGR